jgi:hypothetical protein
VLLTDTVFIGEDDNSGGGSEAGLDASEAYTLDLTGIEPQANQGVHVKLTIHAEGSQGADVKHKVFWVTGCGPGPATTTKPGETTTTKPGETTTTKPGASSTSGVTSSSGETTTTAAVGGSSTTAGGGGQLPFTGAGDAMPLLVVGLTLVGLGAASLLAKARRGGA